MKKTILLVAWLLILPLVTSAWFTDIYGTWVERLMWNPTSMYEQMQSFGSYGQRASVDAELSTPDGEGKLHMATDFQIDKNSNLKWNIALAASWSIEQQNVRIAGNADIVLSSGTLYIKPTITELPEMIPSDEKVWFQLLDGKWIQVNNEASALPSSTMPGVDSLAFAKELSQLVKTSPILKSTKELTRNGYEIYLVQVDESWVAHLVEGVMQTIMKQANMPFNESLATTPLDDFKNSGVKTIGVIGKKWDEIKMGMIIKSNNDPVHGIFTSTSTSSTSEVTFTVNNKKSKETMVSLTMETTIPTTTSRKTHFTFSGASEEHVYGEVTIHNDAYDAWTSEITSPTWAILLDDLMQWR